MSGTFFGINVAESGLAAQRRAMDVLGYNIANANDPTYKRQRLVLTEGQFLAQSQEANPIGSSAFGSGVNSGDIERIRDPLIENRLRQAMTASANWNYRQSAMSELESTIGEPSDTGLQNDLDNFWSSWQKVATQPDSMPTRSGLLQDADALCQRLNYVSRQMSDMVGDLNLTAVDRVSKINQMAGEIGLLNNQIGSLTSGAVPVNDLLNRRDALVQELSKVVDITQHGDSQEGFVISIGGTVLVQGTKVNKLKTVVDANGNQQVGWERDGASVQINGGELQAITTLRDQTIPGYINQLDQVAQHLVTTVNEQNRRGIDLNGNAGGDFFQNFPTGVTAANITLHYDSNPPDVSNPAIVDHPERIAASIPDNPATTVVEGGIGDGSNAVLIAQLKDAPTTTGYTINEMYRNLVGDIGGTSATATTQAKANQLSLDQFTTQQQSISGVSLDEEMTNMIKFQQAYNAAAKVLGVMNDMLNTLVNTNM